jgi:nucleoside-diphosphate-sugar epimerase
MTILVTGAGLIGTHAARALLDQGTGVVLYDPDPSAGYIESVVGQDRKIFYVERGDVRDFPRVMDVVLRRGVTRILHTAAIIGPPASENPGLAFQVNVAGALNLIEVARMRSLARIVLASSSDVYGDGDQPPGDGSIVEHEVGWPSSSFDAAFKAMTEIMALAYQRLAGVNAIIVRRCATYGLGGMWETSAVGWDVTAAVIEAGNGERRLSMPPTELVYVKDVAFAIREALFVEKPTSRVYNVGSGEVVSAADVAAVITASVAGARIAVEDVPAPRPRTLDTTLAARDLGYRPRWPLAAAIPDMLQNLDREPPLKLAPK